MDSQHEVPGERQKDIFCPPIALQNDTVDQECCKFIRGWETHGSRLEYFRPLDRASDDCFTQITYNCLYFRNFCHDSYNEAVCGTLRFSFFNLDQVEVLPCPPLS